MLTTEEIKANLNNVLKETDFNIGKSKYVGKVRDNYILDNKRLIVTSDRISCFDYVVGALPFKGQVLNQLAAFWFENTKHIVDNHIIEVPDPNVMVVKECKPIDVELVVRGYITGSLWRAYEKGEKKLYGLELPLGLRKNQKFDEPIITPSTKAEKGTHDEPINPDEILEKGLMTKEQWEKISEISLRLFEKGTEMAAENNLILVDTKYEFGIHDGKIVLMDEIHTPDSSRFWFLDRYDALFQKSEEQKILDKEYVRQWLIDKGWMGDGPQPSLSDEVKIEAVRRYIQAYEQITGKDFVVYEEPILDRITKNLKRYLE